MVHNQQQITEMKTTTKMEQV